MSKPLNLYDISVPVLTHYLNNLSSILTKASTTASSKGLTVEQLASSRIIDDMQPLPFQITSACNSAKFLAVRVADHPDKVFDDNLTTFEELQARVAETLEFLKGVKREEFDGIDPWTKIVEFRGLKFTALAYVNKFVLPNFYFHVMTAYSIFRMKGIDVGKLDYLGPIKGQELVD